MNIAITGATGHLGRIVASRLKEKVRAADVVALARSTGKASDLGVTTRQADYNRPETLDGAFEGVETLLLISSNEVGRRAAQHGNVIAAAKKAGVQRIVYTSLLRADRSPLTGLVAEHRDTERALEFSGMRYTILRNGWYTENYTDSVPAAVAGGAFLGCAGAGKISSAARADYADAAVVVLTSEGHDGKTYELAGDEAWTLSDLAAEISKQVGQHIPYKDLPEGEFAAALIRFGLPEPVAKAYASFDTGAAQGGLFDDGHQLSKLIGRPTTPLSISVEQALKQRG